MASTRLGSRVKTKLGTATVALWPMEPDDDPIVVLRKRQLAEYRLMACPYSKPAAYKLSTTYDDDDDGA